MSNPIPPSDEATEPSVDPTPPWKARLDATVWRSWWRPLLLLLLCLLPFLGFILVDLPTLTQSILAVAFIAVALIIARYAPQYRLVVAFLSIAASLRYMYWRATETLGEGSVADEVSAWLLFLAEVYAVVVLLTGYFQTAIVMRRRPVDLDPQDPDLPWVDVFIPTYNEPIDVVQPTILGALAMDYRNKRVWVLDDGRRPALKDLCDRLGAGYITRDDNKHAKAGNINEALKKTGAPLIAFFDADHVPTRAFLTATVGFFLQDQKLALVQTPHHFYNPDPFQRNLYTEGQVPPEQHLFYHGVQMGNDFWNSAFFCGSCAVMRRDALNEVGGIARETVTEDAHTALKMHARGWNSVFLEIPLAAGLATESFAAHIGQRIRWARGMAQIFRLDNPLFKRGLSFAQRINYFNASWHFFHGVPRMIFLLAPPAYLILDLHPVDANVREVLLYAIPHLVLAAAGTALINRNVRHSFWPEVYEVAIAPYSAMVTTIAVFAPRRGKFNVTAKGTSLDRTQFAWRAALPHILLFVISAAALYYTPIKLQQSPLDKDTILVAAIWNIYNMIMLLAVLSAALERPQRRRFHRVPRACQAIVGGGPLSERATTLTGEPVSLANRSFEEDTVVIEGQTVDLSLGGFSVRFPGEVYPPRQFLLTLEAPGVSPMPLPAEWLYRSQENGATVLRGQWGPMTPQQEQHLSAVIFSGSEAWMQDRFTFDEPLRAALRIVVTPLVILLRRPRLYDSIRQRLVRRDAHAPLVPALADDRGRVLPLPLRPARTGVFSLTTPTLLLIFALGLSVGWKPLVTLFSRYLPTQRWEGITYQTRAMELGRAYVEIETRYLELKRAVRRARPLPENWNKHVWEIRRNYHLYGESALRPEHSAVEMALDTALLSMLSAEKEYGEGAPSAILDARFDSIEQNLQIAAERLGVPR